MKWSTGVFKIAPTTCACSPAAAVPASAKIPVPMIAPMPMQVRANGPRARFICRSGAAASAIKRSGLFFEKDETPLVNVSRIVSPRLASGQPLLCDAWPANSSCIEHDQSQRRQLDRWLRFWLDRVRRLHLRKANELVEANVP